jgi:hypothetical protein
VSSAGAGSSLKQEAAASNQEVCDKLVDVFSTKDPADWRKLIAYSKQWPVLAQGVFDRWAWIIGRRWVVPSCC